MSDFDDRLRAEALRPAAPPPDFQAALDSAVAAAPPRRLPWVLAAAVVVVLLGLGGVLLLRPDGASHRSPGAATRSSTSVSSPAPGPSGTPSSAPSDVPSAPPGSAIVASDDVGFTGAQLDRHDPLGLIIYVWPPQNGPCGVFDPHPVIDSETATTVVIRVPGRQELPLPATGDSGGYCIPESARVPVRVALGAPLGGRTVVDALHRHEQYVLDPSTVAVPAHLPPGFTGGAVDLSFYEGKPVTRRTWTAPHGTRTTRLEVLDAPRSYVLVGPGTVVGDVGGRPAHLTTDPECLWWSSSASRAMLVCAQVMPPGESHEPPPLPASELLRVARSLS